MAYIDKISVNGSERDLRDAGAARFDETQSLTDAQKQTARANVGAASAADVTALAGRVTTVEGDIDGLEAAVDTKASAADVTALAGRVTTAEGDIDALETALDTKADDADMTALTAVVAGKVDTQQDAANAGKALIVGEDGIVTLGDAGIPAAVAEALLACFRNVAWINWQESGQSFYNALEDALGVHTMSYGVYEPNELVNGRYIDTDGQVKTGTVGQSYYIADYIPVVESSYWIALQPFIAAVTKNSRDEVTAIYSQANWRVSEYDASKTFIKQTHYEMFNYTEYNARVVTFDPNTRYIRLGWNDGNAAVHVFDIEPPHSFSVLPMELGNIDASTGNNTTNSLRIRTNGYIPVTGNTITLIGCPFADSWLALNPNSVYGIRCYDANKNYLGTLQNLPASDIEDYPLLTNTAYIRMIMQYNALVNFSGFSKLVNHLFTVNGTKYYVTEV